MRPHRVNAIDINFHHAVVVLDDEHRHRSRRSSCRGRRVQIHRVSQRSTLASRSGINYCFGIARDSLHVCARAHMLEIRAVAGALADRRMRQP